MNAPNKCFVIEMICKKGKDDQNIYWGIEINQGHQLYLGTYSCIESINHLIKNPEQSNGAVIILIFQ